MYFWFYSFFFTFFIDIINITEAVGIEDFNNVISGFQVSPNTVSSESYLSFFLNEGKTTQFTVYDMIGKAVYNDNRGFLQPGLTILPLTKSYQA